MQDAGLPFRPRVSSPADRALASIEAQALGVRRRVNRFVLEGALFAIGGASLLAFATLVGLAFVLSQTLFAVWMWGLLFVLGFVVITCLRKARSRWMPKGDVALRIDRRAQLDDRLATLAAAPPQARRSRLWDVLLHDNLGLLPRWEPRRFQPRILPRSFWFFAPCLILALLASRELPSRGLGSRGNFPAGAAATAPEEETAREVEPALDDLGAPNWSLWSDLPEDLRQAILGSAATRNYPGNIPQKTQPIDRERGGPAIAGRHMAANGGPVRSAPADADAARFAGQARDGPQPPAPAGMSHDSQSPGDPLPRVIRGDTPKALQSVETGHPRNPLASMTREVQAKNRGGSGSGGAGAGPGGDEAGLFGERQPPSQATGSFALNLDALRSGEPSKEGQDDSPPAIPPRRLAEDQRLDDAVRRAQVPVEYEAIVQRLFNRTPEALP